MKKYLFFLLLSGLHITAAGQTKERLSRAYLGVILHDMNEPGISLVNNFGVNKYLGVGAGVDITRYEGTTLVPVYLDVRVKYPVQSFAPFVALQGGYPLYNTTTNTINEVGFPMDIKVSGKYMLGAGIGVSYNKSKVGIYISYTQRSYSFKYDKVEINSRTITPNDPQNAGVVTIGLLF